MSIFRLLRLDIQKTLSIPLMYVFTLIPALLAFNGWFTSVAVLLYAFLVPYGIFNYDDTSIAENFYSVLPVGRSQIVIARYLFGFFAMILISALILLSNSVCALVYDWPLLAEEFIAALLMGVFYSVIFLAAAYPLTMYLGAMKANMYVLIAFVILFISMTFYGENFQASVLADSWNIIVLPLLALVISCQICIRFYRKRELYDYLPMKEIRRVKGK